MSEINFNDYFYYDETSPSCLRWKVNRMGGIGHSAVIVASDEVAGGICESRGRYYRVELLYKQYSVHRVIWLMHGNSIPVGYQIDHVDGISLNNKYSNLRCVNNTANSRNRRKSKRNTSGVTGVTLTTVGNNSYWTATWRSLEDKQKKKHFSCQHLGYEAAFNEAVNYRAAVIVEMNMLGGGYTVEHGSSRNTDEQVTL